MAQVRCTLRPARRDDAPVLAELVNYAGEGLSLYAWSRSAGPDETGWDVGHLHAAGEEGSISYRNATIIKHNGNAAGCLIGRGIGSSPAPIPSDMPVLFVPLQELENLAPDTWYVNVLARLYERCGYEEAASRAMVKEAWVNEGQNWVLLMKTPRNCGRIVVPSSRRPICVHISSSV
jgi:hypothetical protein